MRSAALTLALLIVVAGLVPVAVPAASADAETAAAPASGQSSLSTSQLTDLGTRTVIVVRLRPDASARWSVRVAYDLESENETRAFQRLGRSFEAGNASIGPDVALFKRAATGASSATGREMRIENVSRDHRIANGTGTLHLQFTWTSFAARTDGGGLALGDVFRNAGNGTWLTSLGPHQRLEIRTPPGYAISENPGFPYQDDSIIVRGPREFDSEQRLALKYEQLTGPTDPAGQSWDIVALVGGAVTAGAALALFLRRRRQPTPESAAEPAPATDSESSTDPGGGAVASPDAGASLEGAASSVTAVTSGDAADTTIDGNGDGVDLSLLSDEERVEHLLEQNGGRMKQANIVGETGWSDAKVSQLLSSMADEGRVDKLRLGRENLISLPDDGE